MRVVLWILALSLVTVACVDRRPSVVEWTNEVWNPLVAAVPQPRATDPARCESALADLRSLSPTLKPAPDVEVGAAADRWLRRAETLMFDCATAADGFDYKAGYEDLSRLADEVSVLLATADG